MTDHELKSWLAEALIYTNPFNRLSGSVLDDTFGWGMRFDKMWKQLPPYGLILTGPDGCGKHTAAAYMFKILTETHCALHLHGRELCADGYVAATKRLRHILDNRLGDGENSYPWCLVLEGLEDCEFRRELFSWMGQALNEEWFSSPEKEAVLFLILIDSIVEDIPSDLRRYLRLCRMALPAASRRRAYFAKMLPTNALNLEILVNATDGLTYAQMVDLAQNLECTGDNLSDELLREFLEEQYPAPVIPDDPLKSLAQTARLFVERLPELMKHMGTAVRTETIVEKKKDESEIKKEADLTGKQQTEEEELAAYTKKVEAMPGNELGLDLFGEEGMAELEQYRPLA